MGAISSGPLGRLVFVQTLPAARSPANCVDAADCNLAAKLRSFVLHHSDWPELIPAESSTENLHWDWYSKRGHFTAVSTDPVRASLLQFRVFRLGLLQDGDVGVGVFPEREGLERAFANAAAQPC